MSLKYRQLGKLQTATADFDFKPGLNLERLGQPNVEPHSHFAAHSVALPRAKHIGPGNLTPESGRG